MGIKANATARLAQTVLQNTRLTRHVARDSWAYKTLATHTNGHASNASFKHVLGIVIEVTSTASEPWIRIKILGRFGLLLSRVVARGALGRAAKDSIREHSEQKLDGHCDVQSKLNNERDEVWLKLKTAVIG